MMSGIVAALLHAAAVYGAIVVWQTRRSTVTPGPISVIALPPGTESPLESASVPLTESVSPLTADVPTATQPASAAPTGTPRPFEPVAPSAVAPAPRPVARPTQSAVSPNGPAPSPAPDAPATPANPPNNGPGVVPPTVPPESPGEVAPPAAGGAPPAAPGIAAAWRREPAPGGGSVIHEVQPDVPETWSASMSALLANTSCAAGISPGLSVTITLWPIIEADGQISEFIPRPAENLGNEALVSCIQALRSQMPPLIPAQDGGLAIVSDEILIIVEIRSTQ
ncbi:MAG: hypothetical protein AAF773_11500 [Cyanobacteria bacterium P01_D01_bin.115]